MFFRFLPLALLAAVAPVTGEDSYPPLKSPGDISRRGAALQRTMSLLESSAVEKRNTVRILFYGQSITEQSWWQQVKADLVKRYPLAKLEIENRAIGGHSSVQLASQSVAVHTDV